MGNCFSFLARVEEAANAAEDDGQGKVAITETKVGGRPARFRRVFVTLFTDIKEYVSTVSELYDSERVTYVIRSPLEFTKTTPRRYHHHYVVCFDKQQTMRQVK